MQMLVEGLAMGAFATIYQRMRTTRCAKKLMQLVMTDEAFHHKFGKIWADRTIPKLTRGRARIVEDWAAQCFQTLLFNLVGPTEAAHLRRVRPRSGKVVRERCARAFTDEAAASG